MMGESQNTLELAAGMRSIAGVWGWHPQAFSLEDARSSLRGSSLWAGCSGKLGDEGLTGGCCGLVDIRYHYGGVAEPQIPRL